MTSIAGTGFEGIADGVVGSVVRDQPTFVTPSGVAVDAAGTLYVADHGNSTIWRVGLDGVITPFAGTGSPGFVDGPGASATFNEPAGIAVGPDGDVYVADMSNHRIRKIDGAGNVSTLAGGAKGYADGPATSASFNEPFGVVLDAAGNVYVADRGNHRIRKVDTQGNVTTLSGSSAAYGVSPGTGGPNGTAQFGGVQAIAIDASGTLYVADNYGVIEQVDPAGNMTIVAGTTCQPGVPVGADQCFADGPGGFNGGAVFSYPIGVAVDAAHNILVADQWNNRIRKIAPGGAVTTLAGSAGQGAYDGRATETSFSRPWGLTIDLSGAVLCADSLNGLVRRIDASAVVTVVAGQGVGVAPSGIAPPTQTAEFVGPTGIAMDSARNTYVTDGNRIRKIDPAGAVTTFAGGEQMGLTDGQPGNARFSNPTGLIVDGADNLIVADTGNCSIRKIDPQGRVTTLAGNGQAGNSDGTGGINGTARFYWPNGVAVDTLSNIYVADTANSAIRKIDTAGNVTTVAGGGGGGYFDGPADTAGFNMPSALVFDASGNLFVSDQANTAIRKMDTNGNVTTVAGSPGSGLVDGPGGRFGTARFAGPTGLAIDASDNLFVVDRGNNAIRKIDPSGNVTTLAGNGQAGFADGTGGLDGTARFNLPLAVTLDAAGNLIITDTANFVLRKVTP